jgi:hypothetical protein
LKKINEIAGLHRPRAIISALETFFAHKMKPLSEVSLKSLAHAQFTIDGAPWYDLSSLPWLPYMRQLWLYLQSIATANNYMPKNHLNWSLQLTKPLPPAIPLESLRQLVCSASQAINQDPVAKQCWEQLTTLHVFELDLNWNNRCLLLIHQEMASLLRVLCLRYCELRDDDLSMLNQLDQLEQMDLLGYYLI